MNHFTSIRIEGSIFSSDILEKLDTLKGQKPSDFGYDLPVKDEIARAWADAQDYWRIFQRRVEGLSELSHGTTETRNTWMVPLLSLLGYKPEVQQKGEEVMGRNFAISHRDPSREGYPIHIMGCRDSLDKKRAESGPRMSPHGLVQEFLNLKEEHLYAIVTNGLQLRLLRDSSRLVKLSYIEFDLEQMFTDSIFSDFAILYRLLHASRMPVNSESISESLIELYHQDSLDSGSRIRDGLSNAVEQSIIAFANGFLNHPDNETLRERMRQSKEREDKFEKEFYQYQLRLIYRLLFLMVIEERNLVFPNDKEDEGKQLWDKFWAEQPPHIPRMPLRQAREIYYSYYSVGRLRNLAGKRYLADAKHSDYWLALKNTFRLFEDQTHGAPLGIRPLAGDLFSSNAVGILNECSLDNSIIIECLTRLTIFEHPDTHQQIRVNYGALNVEEFGSVYEGLLEYDPHVSINGRFEFSFKEGEGRSASGSHYTPDELVSPLIKHSLDYLIEDRVKLINTEIKTQNLRGKENREGRKRLAKKHLLSLSVCDVACGSGHILLNAARRIANECAVVIEEEEQPSPSAFRKAIRLVIQNCIYGVDLNPLAVELCKVALWLEAHNPGEPLNFLDHHIKCGNAIVGLAHKEELQRGIPEEAFKKLADDDKDICAAFRKRNKDERKERIAVEKAGKVQDGLGLNRANQNLQTALQRFEDVAKMPEHTPEEIEAKQQAYEQMQHCPQMHMLRLIADIQVAQFYIPKVDKTKIITDAQYFRYLKGEEQMIGQAVAEARTMDSRKSFFHWFIEFPHIMNKGGFDCILGNPPFLGGKRLTTQYGKRFLELMKLYYEPAGSMDLVGYFFRRIFDVIRPSGFMSLISTNTISQGKTREGALLEITKRRGVIHFAVPSMKWPGKAAVDISLLALHKGTWHRQRVLGMHEVKNITTYLDDAIELGDPKVLSQNEDLSYVGSFICGSGFLMEPAKAKMLLKMNPNASAVLFPYLNAQDINRDPDQKASRWIVNFHGWPIDDAKKYPECFKWIDERVRPERQRCNENGEFALRRPLPQRWWMYADRRPKLYQKLSEMERTIVVPETTKYCTMTLQGTGTVFSHMLKVITLYGYEEFAILSSTFHEQWAWRYSSTMGAATLRYSPSAVFETFAFPSIDSTRLKGEIGNIGESYHTNRKELMCSFSVGMTDVYNLFHAEDLSPELVEKVSKQNLTNPENGVLAVASLRTLHREMDKAVLAAYGWDKNSPALQPLEGDEIGVKEEGIWPAIDLRHDFYEVDYLPENDRIRYTIHPDARKEILKRLLLLNHQRYAEEVAAGLHAKKKSGKKTAKKAAVKKAKIPTALPSTPRQPALMPLIYVKDVLELMIAQSPSKTIPLDKLTNAWLALCEHKYIETHVTDADRVKGWKSKFVDQPEPELRMDALRELVREHAIGLKPDLFGAAEVYLKKTAAPRTDDPWLIEDARIALEAAEHMTQLAELERSLQAEAQELIQLAG